MKTHNSSILISVGVLSLVLLLVLAMNGAPPITSAKGSQGSRREKDRLYRKLGANGF